MEKEKRTRFSTRNLQFIMDIGLYLSCKECDENERRKNEDHGIWPDRNKIMRALEQRQLWPGQQQQQRRSLWWIDSLVISIDLYQIGLIVLQEIQWPFVISIDISLFRFVIMQPFLVQANGKKRANEIEGKRMIPLYISMCLVWSTTANRMTVFRDIPFFFAFFHIKIETLS